MAKGERNLISLKSFAKFGRSILEITKRNLGGVGTKLWLRPKPAAARDGALKARQGTKSEAMYPPACHLKPGAIGDRVAAHPAAPDHSKAHPSSYANQQIH